jgi:glycerophosphoryl diester phosphodiesterase
MIVGHRGAAGHAPENTLLSFQAAIDLKCDKVEMDVHLTKDGEAVVIHDKDVNRTTNGKGLVKSKTLAEIRELDCAKGQKIPTLQEVVNICKGKIPLVVELKAKNTPKIVNQILTGNQIIDSSLVISFDSKLIKEIKKINPEVKTGFLFDTRIYKLFPFLLWRLVKKIKADYVCPEHSLISKNFVKKLHKLNFKIHTYTVNDAKIGEKFKKFGVDQIATDFPKLFL